MAEHAADVEEVVVAFVDRAASEQEHAAVAAVAADADSVPCGGVDPLKQVGEAGRGPRKAVEHLVGRTLVVTALRARGVEVERRQLWTVFVEHARDAPGVEVERVSGMGRVLQR